MEENNMENNSEIDESILAGVEEQLNSKETPYVEEVFNKLIKLGLSSKKAKIKIGKKLTTEVNTILESKEKFNVERHKKMLDEIVEESNSRL